MDNKYVVPRIPDFDQRGQRVLQDFADMLNFLVSENRLLRGRLESLESGTARKQSTVKGMISLAPFAGGSAGFIRVSEEGVIVSYASPSGQGPGSHTITLAPLTGGGTQGSITWDDNGLITAWTDPT